jgi:hypothetical protein
MIVKIKAVQRNTVPDSVSRCKKNIVQDGVLKITGFEHSLEPT